jgi:hypothetical protein
MNPIPEIVIGQNEGFSYILWKQTYKNNTEKEIMSA